MDEYYMNEAIKEARVCTYEVPVGAIIVHEGKIIGRGHNLIETTNDPTTHAEINAIRQASEYLNSWRLLNCTMYVTLEPCAMCAGAIVNSRIERLVIGAMDDKRGCCGSIEDLVRHPKFNHRVNLTIGVLEKQSRQLLKDFFHKLRKGYISKEEAIKD
ncbi:tRNA adenosine(34) deaminase TadA [Tissierella sp. Yu-01]|uniref:tRNA adenosine(34) deaminase TadA n=1 Tax=Tissierella sp. Yu-01 TaxID=3035694 RepID=UPI00240DA222|nr:tRNA adenosine(34) deaminase TadA [Tissierella sp. Yu-01]WFA08395.1 tRNA adenosine(34) deaminase TadA [Tissierella sp. Yu-01]